MRAAGAAALQGHGDTESSGEQERTDKAAARAERERRAELRKQAADDPEHPHCPFETVFVGIIKLYVIM